MLRDKLSKPNYVNFTALEGSMPQSAGGEVTVDSLDGVLSESQQRATLANLLEDKARALDRLHRDRSRLVLNAKAAMTVSEKLSN
jgi:hypothetical protein